MTPRLEDEGARRDWMFVGGAWLAIAIALSVWLAMDQRPPDVDHATHLERAALCAQDMGKGDWRGIVERPSFHPPTVACAAGVVYQIVPSDRAAAQAVILLFLALGMAATYLLARDLGGRTAGLAAALMLGSAPFIVFTALRFQLDLPLAAMVALGLFALLRTDGFTRVGMSALTGVVFAAGMLVAPAFAVYVLAPVVWLLASERSWRAVRNAVLTLVVAAALIAPWYGPRLLGLPMELASRSAGQPKIFTAAALAFYPTWIVPQLGVLAAVLVLVGVVVAVVRREAFAVVAFVAPLVIFMLVRHKDLDYTVPALPAGAALAGTAIALLPAWARVAGLVVVGVVGAVQVSGVTWGVPPAMSLPILDVPALFASPPVRDSWRHREVLRTIANDSAGRPVTVSVVPSLDAFSVSNFRYYALRDGLPYRFVGAWDGDPLGVEYVVLKSGATGPTPTAEKVERATAQFVREPALARVYPVIGEYQLPDGSTATLRARRIPEAVSASPERLAQALETAISKQLGAVARDVDGLTVRIEHDAEIARGRVRRIELSADAARLAEYKRPDAAALRVRRLWVIADDVLVNPFSLEGEGRADLLDIGRLRLARADVSADDVQAFVGGLRAFRRSRLWLTTDAVYLIIRQPGADMSALVKVLPATDRPFALDVQRASLGWLPIPRALVNWVVRHYDPTAQLKSRVPFPVEIGRVTVTEQALRIGE